MNLDSVFFVSCFLPVALVLYWLVPGIRAKNWILLAVSLIFYSFGSLTGLLLLVAVCLGNYLFGLWLQGSRGRKAGLVMGVCLNVAFLAFYKYLDFILAEMLGLPELQLGLAAPIGISFFTFKSISYLADTYRDKEQGTKNFGAFLLYISFFPQVVMGPITRFRDFAPQLSERKYSAEDAVAGLRRFIVGLAKKLMIASTLGAMVDGVYALEASQLDARLAWLGAIGYCLQLYFDFSGYMDMAIGLGRVFGFSTVENFDHPYIASTVGGFWRRWHMSLTGWFRDYVYIPLGGNRKGKFRTGVNKAIVFLLCGIWHGANWTFLLWGIWHGVFSLLESTNVIQAKKLEKSKVLGHIYTLLVVILGFAMFRADSVTQGFSLIGTMFTGFSFADAGTVALHSLVTFEVVAMMLLGIVLSMPVREKLVAKMAKYWEPLVSVAALVLFVLCIVKLAAGDFAPSIYAGF